MKIFALLVSSATVIMCNCIDSECPIVETKSGLVEGTQDYSEGGRVYFAFRGIPFAKPPVGERRFKPPERTDNWTGIYLAKADAAHCLQKNYLFSNPKVEGSEDCLYLNVYTPQIRPSRRRKRSVQNLLPVMVFIHWGGFFCGYSDSNYLGPQYFMDRGVIIVTFNYRLGVLGFLCTNDDASPGNYGLKDQVMALQWVQDNIENFGGNKDKVTIFGQSAGAASVHYHMLSPLSRGLFRQGISESGSALNLWARPFPTNQGLIAAAQANILGCPNPTNTTDIVDCLRKVDGDILVDSGDKFKTFSVDPLNVYGPSIEKKTGENPYPFVTQHPVDYIRNKQFHQGPWIVGINNEEGLLRTAALLRQSETREALNKNFDSIMMNLMGLELSVEKRKVPETWSRIKEFYLEGRSQINVSDFKGLSEFTDLYSDRAFSYSVYQAALFHNFQGHENIWYYNFNYSGQYSYAQVWAATTENIDGYYWGVSHSDELLYLFKTPALFPSLENTNDKRMINNMMNLWTNFAKTGDPTPIYGKRRWLRMSCPKTGPTRNFRYLNIVGSHTENSPPRFEMREGLNTDRYTFWKKLPLHENIPEIEQTVWGTSTSPPFDVECV
nr:unnamed protein product [Callosobruchus analis]